MPIPGADFGSRLGPVDGAAIICYNGGLTAYTMSALNTGFCARFTAPSTKDIKSVRLVWTSVSAPGVVTMTIEPIDATTGKPAAAGTPYDANATYAITPATGVQTYTFATLPTTGLTAGAEYGIVLITTTAGTTHGLGRGNNYSGQYRYPTIDLIAADGTTRSNFAEGIYNPCISIVWEDDTEDAVGFLPYYSYASNNIWGTLGVALKLVTTVSYKVAGVLIDYLGKLGTPAGDLRIRIFDSSNSLVTGATINIDKESLLTGVNGRQVYTLFPAIVDLGVGTYRVILDSASSANSSNCWTHRSSKFIAATGVPANYKLSTCPDVGTPIWTDSITDVATIGLILDSIPASVGGGVINTFF